VNRFLLDTNILSDMIRNPHGAIAARIGEVGEAAIYTSIIVAAELRYGAIKRGSQRLAEQVDAVLGVIDIAPLASPAEHKYAETRARLEAAGLPIGANDLLIAAHALALGDVLVTANTREFSRVEGLAVVDWLSVG